MNLLLKLFSFLKQDDCELIKACKKGDLRKVKELHESGVDIFSNENIAMRTAIQHENVDVIKYLVDAVPHNNDFIKRLIFNNYFNIVKYLHEKGTDISDDNFDIEEIHKADHQDIVDYMLKKRYNVSKQDEDK